ncbi:hypothetical protein KHA80_02230 [Anaerobacillus sp. HL2]|nr:hypothetical protein KHA80_02230 [Anaerobacillus sp. HL2]
MIMIVRTGLKLMIDNQPDMNVIEEAVDGEQAVQKALDCKLIVIMDLNMPKKRVLFKTNQINEANLI